MEAPVRGTSTSSGAVHSRESASEESERLPKHARISAVFEHEDDEHPMPFEDGDVDELESYDWSLDDEMERGSDDVSDTALLKQLCFPYSTAEPQLSDNDLQIDTIADHLEISRLRKMGVLLPTDGYDYKGQVPKRLTTRMVRAWRDKYIDDQRVWLRRSRYVARDFARLSPDRPDLFSPASSVITTRLLPKLLMRWKDDGYVLCSIDVGDAFLRYMDFFIECLAELRAGVAV